MLLFCESPIIIPHNLKVISIKPKKFLIFLFFVLLCANTSLAYSIEKINIECIVNPDDTINETITMVIYNDEYKNLSSISYTIPQNVVNLSINSSVDIGGYSALYNDGVTEIALGFKKPIPPYQYVNVTFHCLITDAIWTKSYAKQLIMNFPISAKNATIKVVLPPGAVILSPKGKLLVTPSGYKITTDGKHQIIIWDLSLNKEITFTKLTKLKDSSIVAGVRDYEMLQYTIEDGHEVRGW
jgi:hypothetical protein